MSIGSIAANFHEGHRSEYLAQYVFASFGTATSVAAHEDHGIDLHCTITERIGQRAWPRAYFTVQVKSDEEPWVFTGAESVRWLLEHPVPLFLCVVRKKEARLRIYHTSERLHSGLFSAPDEVRLVPGTEGRTFQTALPDPISLGAPIVDRTVDELLDETVHANARDCVRAWAEIDAENIRLRSTRMAAIRLPYDYETNRVPVGSSESTMMGPHSPETLEALVEVLEYVGTYERQNAEPLLPVLINMLHRQLTKGLPTDRPKSIAFVNEVTNRLVRGTGGNYLFAGVDHLLGLVRGALGGGGGGSARGGGP